MNESNEKILICDDSILARKQLKDIVTAYEPSSEIIEATNGQQAIDQYKSHHPSLVFLDIVMPEKNGTDAVKEIVDFDENAVIIIVSSVGTQSQLRQAIEAGAKDFIQKPVDAAQVEKIIKTYFEGR